MQSYNARAGGVNVLMFRPQFQIHASPHVCVCTSKKIIDVYAPGYFGINAGMHAGVLLHAQNLFPKPYAPVCLHEVHAHTSCIRNVGFGCLPYTNLAK